ncbi:hypothetical protein KIH87_05765 [Paraneptunicella aestuarii]|uniref:hypothetical protein n=1 Tax=Paraneptunicella aestuarii TaxID=2831148 RepID=UPI001E2B1DD8|nr:hypothetical protein [Paraneptunicella aestuarii]UAA39860.1 hypothetical protein KIH87_05765 [Paraneptunicella aestuarii]
MILGKLRSVVLAVLLAGLFLSLPFAVFGNNGGNNSNETGSENESESEGQTENIPLEMHLSRPMRFPKITINEASKDGSVCVANDGKNPQDSLCANAKGNSAKLTIRGNASAQVFVQSEWQDAPQQGFAFRSAVSPQHLTLDKNGKADAYVQGHLTLVDKHAVRDGSLPFTYTLLLSYQ